MKIVKGLLWLVFGLPITLYVVVLVGVLNVAVLVAVMAIWFWMLTHEGE